MAEARSSGRRCKYCGTFTYMLNCKNGVHDKMWNKAAEALICPQCDYIKVRKNA